MGRINSKLYGVLKGYETVAYTGKPKSVVLTSAIKLIQDEAQVLFSEDKRAKFNLKLPKVTKYIDKFLTKYYTRMLHVRSTEFTPALADKSKASYSTLEKLVDLILQGDKIPFGCMGLSSLSKDNEPVCICDIHDKCPYYFNKKFCIIYSFLEDVDGDLIGQPFEFEVEDYKYLALAIVQLTHLLLNLGIDLNDLPKTFMLYNHILFNGKIFELMNPVGKARQDQIDKSLKCLTQEPIPYDTPEYLECRSLLFEVFDDIKEGKLEYIKEFHNALEKLNGFLHSPYDYDLDPYFSCKGTGQGRYTDRHMSIVSSIKEIDWYKDLFTEYDNYIGFKSPYKERTPDLDLERDEIYCIRTILINNPGKFKGRVIHILDNPLQDRANYIHRRLQALTDELSTDCSRHQEDGREFLKNATYDWYTCENTGDREGIYCFDFSNATDTLDHQFQYDVLNFLMGPEVAKFWDQLSKLPKFFQNADKETYVRYNQRVGQPQGGLGSFDSFSLDHLFIFLMDIKHFDLVNYPASDLTVILGDDSAFRTRIPEKKIFKRNEILDSAGISRSEFEEFHFKICQHLAGFEINYSKSNSTHWDDAEAKLEFAKVSYKNGEFFSPIPFRLAMKYSLSLSDQLAVAIWRGERSEPYAQMFMDTVLNQSDLITRSIIESGVVPYLSEFRDDFKTFNQPWLHRLSYAYGVSLLNYTLSCLVLSDNKRDWAVKDTFTEGLELLFSKQDLEGINSLDPNHKACQAILKNIEIIEELSEIYEYDDIDSQSLRLLISPINKLIDNTELSEEICHLSKLHSDLVKLKQNPDLERKNIIPTFNLLKGQDLQKFANQFLPRGIARKPGDEVEILSNIKKTLTELDEILGYIHPVKGFARITNSYVI